MYFFVCCIYTYTYHHIHFILIVSVLLTGRFARVMSVIQKDKKFKSNGTNILCILLVQQSSYLDHIKIAI